MKNILRKYWKVIIVLLIVYVFASCGKKKYPPEYFFQDSNAIALCNAISDHNEAEIDRLLNENVNVNEIGKDGMTPLFWALKEKDKVAFEKLLKKGADPNIKINTPSTKNMSVLLMACRINDISFLKIIVKYVNKKSKIKLDENVLTYALQGIDDSSLKKIQILVEAGANLNSKAKYGVEKGVPPLINAAMLNQFDIVYYLLRQGADPMLKADPLDIPMRSSSKNDGLSLIHLIEQSNELMSRKGKQYKYLRKCAKFLKKKGIKVDVSKPQKYPEPGVKQYYDDE